jgi:integrase/recombinase XerC
MLKYLTDAEISRVRLTLQARLQVAHNQFIPLRNSAMVSLMLHAGLRISEVCSLKLNQIFAGGNIPDNITLAADHCKTGTGRTLPISTTLRGDLAAYISYYFTIAGPEVDPSLPAFPRFKTHNFRGLTAQLKIRAVQVMLLNLGASCGVAKLTPHVLRHTFATRLLPLCNIRVIQALLGHRCLSSTPVYTHVNLGDMTKAVNQLLLPGIE